MEKWPLYTFTAGSCYPQTNNHPDGLMSVERTIHEVTFGGGPNFPSIKYLMSDLQFRTRFLSLYKALRHSNNR
jgi:hypothetical protein